MSGVAGADRIEREFVEPTIRDFTNRVLSKFPGYESAQTSGSYNTSAKKDFGDIDLIVHIKGTDKKTIKKDLQNYLESLPASLIIPFDGKHQGRRSYNAGELVSIRYPQFSNPGKSVQIDCIVALDENESNFKKTFLDYPAEMQGLMIGLVKIAYQEAQANGTEENLLQGFNIDITSLPNEPNTRYEFNLSGQKLEFRTYEESEDGSEVKGTRNIHWYTTRWDDVTRLLSGYNFDRGFEDLLYQIDRNVKNPTSKDRVKGMFNSMVSVKSGEVGTQKEITKNDAKRKVSQVLEDTDLSFIQILAESRLFRFLHTQKYSWDFLCELTFVSILVIHILRHYDVTEDFAKQYLKKTDKLHNFDRPMLNLPDLYMGLHGCIGKHRKLNMFSEEILSKKLNVDVNLLRKYMIDLHNGIDSSNSRRHLYRLQKEFKIKGNIVNYRRYIQEWPSLESNQKHFILQRLYRWLVSNARYIDFFDTFVLVLRLNNVHIPNNNDK